jgi:hypothetical protein
VRPHTYIFELWRDHDSTHAVVDGLIAMFDVNIHDS